MIPDTPTALTNLLLPFIIIGFINQALQYKLPTETTVSISTFRSQLGKFDKHGTVSFSVVMYLFIYSIHNGLSTLYEYILEFYYQPLALKQDSEMIRFKIIMRIGIELILISLIGGIWLQHLQPMFSSRSSIVMLTLLGWLMVLTIAFVNMVFRLRTIDGLDGLKEYSITRKIHFGVQCIGGVLYGLVLIIVINALYTIKSRRSIDWYRYSLQCNETYLSKQPIGEVPQKPHVYIEPVVGTINPFLILIIFLMVQFRVIMMRIEHYTNNDVVPDDVQDAYNDTVYCLVILAWSMGTILKEKSLTTTSWSDKLTSWGTGMLIPFTTVGLIVYLFLSLVYPSMIRIKGVKNIAHSRPNFHNINQINETVVWDDRNRIHYRYTTANTKGSTSKENTQSILQGIQTLSPDRMYFINNRFINSNFIGKSSITEKGNLVSIINILSMMVLLMLLYIVLS